MTLYSGQITQLLQGVSQQHPKDRAEGQIGEQINCVSDVVQGLRRRPAAKILAELSGLGSGFTLDEHTAVYAYERGDGNEKYIAFFDTAGNIKVFDAADGSAKTVTNTASTYLACSDPITQLRFHTIADTTFMLNTTKTITSKEYTSTSPSAAKQLIVAKQCSYGRKYIIRSYANQTIAEVSTPSTVTISSTTIDKTLTLSTDDLIKALVDGTNPGGWSIVRYLNDGVSWTGKSDWTWSYDKNYIVFSRTDGLKWPYSSSSWKFKVYDGSANNDMNVYDSRITSTDDLPTVAPYGYLFLVTNTEEANGTESVVGYYNDSWNETHSNASGEEYGVLASSMPHKLVRGSGGAFTAGPESWRDRTAGTNNSNPVPSFIDRTATGIGTYQNRLFITSEENVCMTRAFDKSAWFAESVIAPSDDDPIDSSSSDNQVTNLLHAVNYQGSLVLFSNTAQFIHPKDQPLTPATYGVSAVTRYNVSPAVAPIVTGSAIVFPTEFGNYTHMWEFDTNTISGNPRCEENTKHVSRYVVGKPVQVIGNTNTEFVFVRTDDAPTTIYVFQSYFKDEKRAQLAWHKWTFPNCDNILNISLLQQTLYLVCDRGGTITLETIDLSMPLTENSAFELFLDHHYVDQVTTGAYTISDVEYTARVPLRESSIEYFVQGDDCTNEGFRITDYAIDSGYVYFNQPANAYVIQGYQYTSEGVLTSPYIVDQQGRPYTKQTIIENINVNLQDTGFCNFCIEHKAGADYEQAFSGIVLNNWQYKIGEASHFDTDVYIPVRDYRELINIKFNSNHHLGFSLMSYEWEARMQSRGRRSQ